MGSLVDDMTIRSDNLNQRTGSRECSSTAGSGLRELFKLLLETFGVMFYVKVSGVHSFQTLILFSSPAYYVAVDLSLLLDNFSHLFIAVHVSSAPCVSYGRRRS